MSYLIGVCEWSLPVSGPSSVTLAAKAGFDGIQLGDLGGAEQGYPMNSPSIQEGYLQAAADWHVQLHSLHPYGLQRNGNLLFPLDTLRGRQGAAEVEQCVKACAAMKIPSLMLSSFFATLVRNEWEFQTFAQQLRRACQVGREHGVRIVYESILSPRQILRMIDMTGNDLTICYDTLNPIRWGTGNPLLEIPLLRGHIDYFHLKDAPFDLKGYAMLGEGRGNFQKTVPVMREALPSGWLVSENYYALLSAEKGIDFMELAKREVSTIRSAFL